MAVAVSDAPTIQQAFQQAKEEHSTTERAQPVEASTGAVADTPPDEAKAQPPATDGATPEISDLISDEELQSLRTKTGNDPDKLAKELKAVFTKKTQALADERKAVEELADYREFIADLKADPAAALTRAAEQFGLVLSQKPASETATETATATATTLADKAVAQFRAALGPDLDFLADKLAPAIQALAQDIAKTAVGEAVEPLKASQTALMDKAAAEQTEATLKTFTDRHPDWKTHEPAMLKVGLLPSPGMSELDYMEALYTLATKDSIADKAAKAAIERLTKGAAQAEGKEAPVSGDKVAITRTERPTMEQAFAEAVAELAGKR